eukprot:scaffold44829_cov160-Amphora_coffeaeformis.AAC.1
MHHIQPAAPVRRLVKLHVTKDNQSWHILPCQLVAEYQIEDQIVRSLKVGTHPPRGPRQAPHLSHNAVFGIELVKHGMTIKGQDQVSKGRVGDFRQTNRQGNTDFHGYTVHTPRHVGHGDHAGGVKARGRSSVVGNLGLDLCLHALPEIFPLSIQH